MYWINICRSEKLNDRYAENFWLDRDLAIEHIADLPRGIEYVETLEVDEAERTAKIIDLGNEAYELEQKTIQARNERLADLNWYHRGVI